MAACTTPENVKEKEKEIGAQTYFPYKNKSSELRYLVALPRVRPGNTYFGLRATHYYIGHSLNGCITAIVQITNTNAAILLGWLFQDVSIPEL